jgi:hypothetical protein
MKVLSTIFRHKPSREPEPGREQAMHNPEASSTDSANPLFPLFYGSDLKVNK